MRALDPLLTVDRLKLGLARPIPFTTGDTEGTEKTKQSAAEQSHFAEEVWQRRGVSGKARRQPFPKQFVKNQRISIPRIPEILAFIRLLMSAPTGQCAWEAARAQLQKKCETWRLSLRKSAAL